MWLIIKAGGGEEEEKENEIGTKPAARRHVTLGFGLWRDGGVLSHMRFLINEISC